MPGLADDIGKLTPHLRRFSRALVRGHAAGAADDIVQETIVLACRAEGTKRGSALAVWCFATLIRLNRLRNRAPLVLEADPSGSPLPFLPKDIVRLDALPLEFREVLLLTTVAGLAYGQVADVLDIDHPNVLSRLTQARDLLTKADAAPGGRAAAVAQRARQAGGSPYLRLVK